LKIVVTGSKGMLGSAICTRLESFSKIDVFRLSRNEVNLTSKGAVGEYLADVKPDLVIHAAAKVGGIQANINEPLEFLSQNLLIDSNIILESLSQGVPKLLYVGSSCMYPKNRPGRLIESDIMTGALESTNEGYALAKIVGARLCEYATETMDVSYKTIIPSNLFGPGDNFNPNTSHLLASIIRKVHSAKEQGLSFIEVWGSGEVLREFTFVEDVADWIVLSINRIEELPQYLNLGVGEDFSVNDYYMAVLRVIGLDAELVHDLSRPEGVKRKLLDSSLARSVAFWNPQTKLEEGIRKTYKWFLENK
jgi:GDP-L-fucose synthase